MKPAVGRIVHVTQQSSPEHVPGIVCYVHPPGAFKSDPATDGILINVGAWDPRGRPTEGLDGVPEDQTGKRVNAWHWPEREEDEEEETEDSE
jgi:hypothetical protein